MASVTNDHDEGVMADDRGTDYVGAPPLGDRKSALTGARRVALVIGNGAYRHTTRLPNPANDAHAIAAKLTMLGFEVVGGAENGIDLDYGAMAARIRDFGRRLREGADTALLFFAGHGIQVHGRNYLVPVDAACEVVSDVGSELFELQILLNQMERKDRTSIVMLDACRNNPLAQNLAHAMGLDDARSAGITEGLAEQRVVAGTLIAYATQPGHVAYDGDRKHGFFTEALLDHIEVPGRDVELMLRDVRGRVIQATGSKRLGAQVPWVHSSLLGAFFFRPGEKPAQSLPQGANPIDPGATTPATQRDADDRLWARIEGSERSADYLFYLEQFPTGRHAPLARFEIRRLEEVKAASRQHVEASIQDEAGMVAKSPAGQMDTAPPSERRFEVRVGDGKNDRTVQLAPGETAPKDAPFAPEMVLVPPGKFWMGSRDDEGEANERPRHEVTIGYPLLVGKYPITFDEWDAFDRAGGIVEIKETSSGPIFNKTESTRQKSTPSDGGWGRGRRPVINVSWRHAKAYASWLSQATGKTYRLLSEAEWEHACRAGSIGKWSFGDDAGKLADHAWYLSNSGGKTQPVGGKPPNAFGLHDMHGNVWEWCEDARSDNYQGAPVDGSPRQSPDTSVSRVIRGGTSRSGPLRLRAASRDSLRPDGRDDLFGFRLARTLPPTP